MRRTGNPGSPPRGSWGSRSDRGGIRIFPPTSATQWSFRCCRFRLRVRSCIKGGGNVRGAAPYRPRFPALIHNWRAEFAQGEVLFNSVQPVAGMAVCHGHRQYHEYPLREQTGVGRGLSLWARAGDYGHTERVCSWLLFRACETAGSRMRANSSTPAVSSTGTAIRSSISPAQERMRNFSGAGRHRMVGTCFAGRSGPRAGGISILVVGRCGANFGQ